MTPDTVTPTVEAELAEALSEVARSWGVRSGHGEWTDAEAQRDCARDMLRALAPYVARHAALAAQAALDDVERRFNEHGEWAWLMPRLLGPVREVRAALGDRTVES